MHLALWALCVGILSAGLFWGCTKEYVNYEAELQELHFVQLSEDALGHMAAIQLGDTLRPSSTHNTQPLPSYADLQRLIPIFKLSEGATADIESGKPIDCSNGTFEITVTSEDGNYSRRYVISLSKAVAMQSPVPIDIRESGVELKDFHIKEAPNATIVQDGLYIRCEVPVTLTLQALTPEFTLSKGATAEFPTQTSYELGKPFDFTKPFIVKVTSEDSSAMATYAITVDHPRKPIGSEAGLTSFRIEELASANKTNISIQGSRIYVGVPYPTSLNELTPYFEVSPGAKASIQNGRPIDLSKPLEITVTSENGSTENIYTVIAYQKHSSEVSISNMRMKIPGLKEEVTPVLEGTDYVLYSPRTDGATKIEWASAQLFFDLAENSHVEMGDGVILDGKWGKPAVDLNNRVELNIFSQDKSKRLTRRVVWKEITCGNMSTPRSQLLKIGISGGGIKGVVEGEFHGTYIQFNVPTGTDLSKITIDHYEWKKASWPMGTISIESSKDNFVQVQEGSTLDFSKGEVRLESRVILEKSHYVMRAVCDDPLLEEEPTLKKLGIEGLESSCTERAGVFYMNVAPGSTLTGKRLTYEVNPSGAKCTLPKDGSVDLSKANSEANAIPFTITSEKGSIIRSHKLVVVQEMNDEAELRDFRIEGIPDADRSIFGSSIEYETTLKVDVKNLKVTFSLPRGAKCNIQSGSFLDFSSPQSIKVTSENGKIMRSYLVSVKVKKHSGAKVESFKIRELSKPCSMEGAYLLFGPLRGAADATKLTPEFTISEGATADLESGKTMDLSKPVKFKVVSEDGNFTRIYTIMEAPDNLRFDMENWTSEGSSSTRHEMPTGGWSSGNVGVAIAKGLSGKPARFPGRKSTDAKEGSFAAVLSTELLEVAGKRIAAGAYYLGSFNKGNVMGDPLACTRFGIDWTGKLPERFKGWYKYTPGPSFQDAGGKTLPGTDRHSILAILYYGKDNNDILTGHNLETSERIIAKAEVPYDGPKSVYTQFDIPFVYTQDIPTDQKLFFTIVLSSSKEGANFIGAVGSELIVDELEIVYKK